MLLKSEIWQLFTIRLMCLRFWFCHLITDLISVLNFPRSSIFFIWLFMMIFFLKKIDIPLQTASHLVAACLALIISIIWSFSSDGDRDRLEALDSDLPTRTSPGWIFLQAFIVYVYLKYSSVYNVKIRSGMLIANETPLHQREINN